MADAAEASDLPGAGPEPEGAVRAVPERGRDGAARQRCRRAAADG